jgi:hypothetical protein
MGALGAMAVPVPSVATILAAVAEQKPTVAAGEPLLNAMFGTRDSVCVEVVFTNVFLVAVRIMLKGGAVADVFLKKNDAELWFAPMLRLLPLRALLQLASLKKLVPAVFALSAIVSLLAMDAALPPLFCL